MKTKIWALIFIVVAVGVGYFVFSRKSFFEQQYFSENTLEEAENLEQRASNLYQQGHCKEAISLTERVLTIRRQVLKSAYSDEAMDTNNLALLYANCGDDARAELLYQQSLKIGEKHNSEDPNVAITLTNLAALYVNRGAYTQAKPLYNRALTIMDKLHGQEYLEVAGIIANLAALYVDHGEDTQAELFVQRTQIIWEQTLGPDQILIGAFSLNKLVMLTQHLSTLARVYEDRGKYTQAELLYQRALDITKKALGAEYPLVATLLNNLANLYYKVGDFTQAESFFQQALTIQEKIFPQNHPDIAKTLANLATLYNAYGQYAKVEPLLQQALAIDKQVYGSEHPEVATVLTKLAHLYAELGKYESAEPLFQQALTIRKKMLPADHLDLARSLHYLALLYCIQGKDGEAESLFQQALSIRKKMLPPDHLDVAENLHYLAFLYIIQGKYKEAEPLFQRMLTIVANIQGKDHSTILERNNLAQMLSNLARLFHSQQRYTQAELLFLQALSISKQTFGTESQLVAVILTELAENSIALDKIEQAYEFYKQAQQLDEKLIDQVLGFTSEKDKLAFVITKQKNLFCFLSFISQYLPQNQAAKKDVFDVWLRRKGIILETQKQFQEALQRRFQKALVDGDNPESMHTFQELSRVQAKLSNPALINLENGGSDTYKQQISELEAQKEQLQAQLSRQSRTYLISQKIVKADTNQVAAALPPHTALLEFAKINMFNFKATGQEEKWQSAHYLVFVLHAGKPDGVELVDLGDAEKIDQAVAAFKRTVANRSAENTGEKSIAAAQQLYQLVFEPLRKELGDVQEIFISPDGNLNLIPFEVLRPLNGKFLIEDYTFTYLAAGRDLVGFGQPVAFAAPQPPLLMGDPDFDAVLQPASPNAQEANPSTVLPASFQCLTTFQPLPYTESEVILIQAHFGAKQAKLFTDQAAVEIELEQTNAPRILHLATHGFFLADQEFALDDKDRGLSLMGAERSVRVPLTKQGVPFEYPLLRSGIVLAGVNSALKAGRTDGVVTAEKILGLNLHGTELVVLSACETGLGDVQVGEGVYGLRRAFLQAGAQSLIMSLWKVNDPITKDLMDQVYQSILQGELRNQALRQAALQEMRVVNALYGQPDPYYWGAFVFLGQP